MIVASVTVSLIIISFAAYSYKFRTTIGIAEIIELYPGAWGCGSSAPQIEWVVEHTHGG